MSRKLDQVDQEIGSIARVLSQTADDNPNMRLLLLCLANAHDKRFDIRREPDDIHKVIEYKTIVLTRTPDDDSGLPNLLSEVGTAHAKRFKRLGDMVDFGKASEFLRLAVELIPEDDHSLPHQLVNLAVIHKCRFEHLGEEMDIEKAIEYELQAIAMTPNEHQQFPEMLEKLGTSYLYRFQRSGEPNDLEIAIDNQSRAIALTPDDHPQLPGRLANLAASYSDRFRRLGELSDLEQAMKHDTRALALTPDGHPQLFVHLANLALCHKDRFRRLGDLSDLEQALKHETRALELIPNDHPHLSIYLDNLAVSHKERFERLGELSDLEQSIKHENRALILTPDDHPELSRRLANLAVSHKDRFRHLGEPGDLEKAIGYGSYALVAITADHPDFCVLNFNHAQSYIDYHKYSHNPTHLQQSLSLFRTACAAMSGAPRARFRHARVWASHAVKYNALNPIEAYQATIDLLPQFIWLGATADQRYQDLKSVQSLTVDAAHAAIVSLNYQLALEWLEHTRCVVWSQNLMLRSPLDFLMASYPALATRLQTVANQLHTACTTSRESQASSRSITSEQVGRDHRRLAKEYEHLLIQARMQPGFEDSLRPVKAAGLTVAARNGPIVVINCHRDGCHAILVLPGQSTISHLPLPAFSGKKAYDAHLAIRLSLSRKGIRERGFRFHEEPRRKDEFEGVLKLLWTDVVKPILDFLGYKTCCSLDELPHITWCPTGAASFLPLHAAGDYDQPSSRVFNYAISSYTPTLAALLNTSPSRLTSNSRVLAIGQAATPGHSPLPGTRAELNSVRSHFEDKVQYSELTDAQATPVTVLHAMEEHDWVHLACHAHQNVHDPTKSGFFLHEGTLDLATINQRSFHKKGLAFLSACQTATGDEMLPDEAVHLASGMLMAGYSSVVATMWSVADSDAPLVADKVYSQLMKKGTLGNGEAGRALYDAVGELRASVGEKQFGRWVPFIHIGS